jgi:predicted transposase/invertase (TIGR01784 family)
MAKKNHNIHDKYVRESFSDPSRAVASLETILPADLKDLLQLDTLKVLKESYMDEVLSEYFSDLVFEINLKNTREQSMDVALLFEHKSAPDKNVLIQVGYYIFAYYHKCILNKKALKPLIPIIYYQGKKKWTVPEISKLFEKYPTTIQTYLPVINHILVALHSVPDDTLLNMKNTMMAAAMVAQKWRDNPVKLADDVIKILSLFRNEFEDRNFLQQTFVYILSASDIKDTDIKKIAESIPTSIKDEVMTTYARIVKENKQIGFKEGEQIGIQKGEQIGIQKGIQKGADSKLTEVVLNGFENKVPLDLLAAITKLTDDDIYKILKDHGKM